jgi:hypothetical protein
VENKILLKNDQLEKEIRRVKKQNDEIVMENKNLESQNNQYLESLIRYAKGDKAALMGMGIGMGIPPQSHFSKKSNTQSFSYNFTHPEQARLAKAANLSK